jgi:hypothetical protein
VVHKVRSDILRDIFPRYLWIRLALCRRLTIVQ